jgi:hypothetical protein
MSTPTIPPALLSKLGTQWGSAFLASCADGPLPVVDVLAYGAAIGLTGKALYDYYQNNKLTTRNADFDPNKTPTAPTVAPSPRHTGHGTNSNMAPPSHTSMPTQNIHKPAHTGHVSKEDLSITALESKNYSPANRVTVGKIPEGIFDKKIGQNIQGDIVLDDGNLNAGRIHIQDGHGAEIKEMGVTIDEFVKEVVNNAEKIWSVKSGDKDSYALTGKVKGKLSTVILKPDLKGLKVITAYPLSGGVSAPTGAIPLKNLSGSANPALARPAKPKTQAVPANSSKPILKRR